MRGCPKARTVLLAAVLPGTLLGGVATPGDSHLPVNRLPQAAGIPVATLSFIERLVERESDGKDRWRAIREGERLRTGDRIRTGPQALARIEFPWMSLTAGASTTLYVPASVILSTVLEQGRAELQSESRDIVKVRTAEAEIRGKGRLVVRRERDTTTVMVMAMEGAFRVEAAGETVALETGEGTVVRGRRRPDPPSNLPAPPTVVRPGTDPVYSHGARRRPCTTCRSWTSTPIRCCSPATPARPP
jgi:hypothetical protein